MQTSRRGIITIAIIMIALVTGVVLTVLHFNRNGEGNSAQQTNGNNAADAPQSDTNRGGAAENRPQPTPPPAASSTQATQSPTELANTGPGDMAIVFMAATVVGGVSHMAVRRRVGNR